MNKLVSAILVLILSFLLSAGLSRAEELKITTYYPSPAGVYKHLRVNDLVDKTKSDLTIIHSSWPHIKLVCADPSNLGTCDDPKISLNCTSTMYINCTAEVDYIPALVVGQNTGSPSLGILSYTLGDGLYTVTNKKLQVDKCFSDPAVNCPSNTFNDGIVPWPSGAAIMGVSDSTAIYGIGLLNHPGVYGYGKNQYGVYGTIPATGLAAVMGEAVQGGTGCAVKATTAGSTASGGAAFMANSYDSRVGYHAWKPPWKCTNGKGDGCSATGNVAFFSKFSTDRAPALAVGSASSISGESFATQGYAAQFLGVVTIDHRPPIGANQDGAGDVAIKAGLVVRTYTEPGANAAGAPDIKAAILSGGKSYGIFNPNDIPSVFVEGGPLDVTSYIKTPYITVSTKMLAGTESTGALSSGARVTAANGVETMKFSLLSGGGDGKILVSDPDGNASWKTLVCVPKFETVDATVDLKVGDEVVNGTVKYEKCTSVECELQ